jgi:hypothetical protein
VTARRKTPSRKPAEAHRTRRTRRQPRVTQSPYLLVREDLCDPVRERFGRFKAAGLLLELPTNDPQHPTDG